MAGSAWLLAGVLGSGVIPKRSPHLQVGDRFRIREKGNFFRLFLGSLGLILLVGGIRATNPLLTLRFCLFLGIGLFVTHLAATCRDPESGNQNLLKPLLYSTSCIGLYGIAQIFQLLPGAPIESRLPPGISTLGNQNQLAGLASILFFPSLTLWMRSQQKRAEWFASRLISFVLLMVVFLCGATGPQLSLAGAGLLSLPPLFLLHSRWEWSSLRIFIVGVTLATFGGIFLMGLGIRGGDVSDKRLQAAPIVQQVLDSNHWDIRRTNWQVAWQMFLDSPVTGVGAGNFFVHMPETRAELGRRFPNRDFAQHAPIASRAHNEYFQWIAETGWLGLGWLVLMGGYLGRSWFQIYNSYNARTDRLRHFLLSAGVITACILCLVSFPLHTPAIGLTTAVLLGLCCWPTHSRKTTPDFVVRRWSLFSMSGALFFLLGFTVLFFGGREFVADLNRQIGSRYFLLGEHETAAPYLDRGVSWAIWPEQGRMFKGLCQAALGSPMKAESSLQASLLEAPAFETMLSLAEIKIEQKDFSTSGKLLSIVEGCGPIQEFRRQAAYLRGLEALRGNDLHLASKLFTDMLPLFPASYRAMLALGYLDSLEGRKNAAAANYRQAVITLESLLAGEIGQGPITIPKRIRWQGHLRTARQALRSVADS